MARRRPPVPAPAPTSGRAGRAGRGRRAWAGGPAAQDHPLAAAGFLALLRGGGVQDAAAAELVGGVVCRLPTLAASEAEAVVGLGSRLTLALARLASAVGAGAEVRVRPLVRLGEGDMLRPELAVLAPAERRGAAPARAAGGYHHLGGAGAEPREVILAVELARVGRHRLVSYARAGVKEVWLLDLERSWAEAYRAPWAGAFTSRTLWYPGEEVPLGGLPGVATQALAFD